VWRYSRHALEEMRRRGISEALVERVLNSPDQQVSQERDGIVARQAIVEFPDGRSFLLRLFVNPAEPATVVTVYRTSKIGKYWRQP
jgi:hypothetical protein